MLYSFLGGKDGAAPRAGLTCDAAGSLYGTTQGQGSADVVSTVFKLDTRGQETVLHILTNPESGSSAGSTRSWMLQPLWHYAFWRRRWQRCRL